LQEVINAVVIDDEIEDIIGITTALTKLGISTLPIHYDDPTSARSLCRKAAKASPRIIITDIQLRGGGADPTATDLSNVAACLGEVVKGTNGPYVVLAWTSKPDTLDALRARVEEYFDKTSIRRPIYFDGICKDDCSTAPKVYDADKILEQFGMHLKKQAALPI